MSFLKDAERNRRLADAQAKAAWLAAHKIPVHDQTREVLLSGGYTEQPDGTFKPPELAAES
jgi:hypothetical protein